MVARPHRDRLGCDTHGGLRGAVWIKSFPCGPRTRIPIDWPGYDTAVGLPGLVLWGETAADIWRPPSEKVTVLRHVAGLKSLPVAEVLAQLRKVLVAS